MSSVTVVIPTFNRAEYLRECLCSVFASSDNRISVIVSDNASTDHTRDVVESFSDPRLTYHRNERNLGAEQNFYRLFEIAQGDYVFCLADDDCLVPNSIESVLQTVYRHPEVGVIVSGLTIVDAVTGEQQGDYRCATQDRLLAAGHDALVALLWLCHVYSGIVVRRDLIDLSGLRRQLGRHVYSYMWVPAVAMKARPACHLATSLVKHRINNTLYWEHPADMSRAGMIFLARTLLPGTMDLATLDALIAQLTANSIQTLDRARSCSGLAFLKHVVALAAIKEMRRSRMFWRNVIVSGLRRS